MRKKQSAFTLVELIVTMAVLAVLAAIAVPSFTTMIANNRSSSLGREFAAAINLVRAEAIKRGGRVSICVSSNGSSCAAASTNWNAGWLIFVDGATSDTAAPSVGTLIQYHQGDSRSSITVVKGATAQAYFRFTGQGILARAVSDTTPITINAQYTGCNGTNAQQIEVGLAGRVSQSKTNCS